MKFVVGGLLVAATLLGSIGTSQAQTWMWPFAMCRDGFKYDEKRDVCVEQKAKKAKAKVAKAKAKKK